MSKRHRPSPDSEFDEDHRAGATASSSPAVTQSPTPWKLSAIDFHFSLLIAAALKDRRETKMYSLVATYDTYDKPKDVWEAYLENEASVSVASPISPPSRGPTSGVSDSPDPILLVPASRRMDTLVQASSFSRSPACPTTPTTFAKPNPGFKAVLRRSTRVPDIAAVLHFSASPFSDGALPELRADRVVLIVEIKPKRMARHAFHEDESLKAVGAIMAFGNRWRYSVIQREDNPPRSWSEERDPTYQDDPKDSDSDDADDLPTFEPDSESEDSEPEEVPRPKMFLPGQLQLLNQEFELLDSEGLFLNAFQAIVQNLKQINADVWK
ncbi:hypothetical protein BU15DRAFT_67330 [Melanogaster broomeanus]|nr:hypothetical protein BU15DRAFT_67330 [Melanogaster broomeanus]